LNSTEEQLAIQLAQTVIDNNHWVFRAAITGFTLLLLLDVGMFFTGLSWFDVVPIVVAHVAAIMFTYHFIHQRAGKNWEQLWIFRTGTPVYINTLDTHAYEWLSENVDRADYYEVALGVFVVRDKSAATAIKLMRTI